MTSPQNSTGRILVTLDFPPEHGGIQRYLHSIVMHTFSSKDLVIAPCRALQCNDESYPCRVLRVPSPFPHTFKLPVLILMFFFLLRQVFCSRKHQPVVYAGNIFAAAPARLCSLLTGVQYHIFTYGTELIIHEKTPLIRTVIWKHLLLHAQQVYYLSTTTRTLVGRYIPTERCVQIPPKIDFPLTGSVIKKASASHTISLLSVGRLVPHKGFSTLLEALTLLHEKPYRCTIAGNGPEYTHLRHSIHASNLQHSTALIAQPHDSEIHALYHEADIFIFPSIDTPEALEGFGIVLLEAMSHRCAIIASDCAAAREVFLDAKDAVRFFRMGDAASLAAAITDIAENPHTRDKMVENALNLLGAHYVW